MTELRALLHGFLVIARLADALVGVALLMGLVSLLLLVRRRRRRAVAVSPPRRSPVAAGKDGCR